jgi:phage terminase small subunit
MRVVRSQRKDFRTSQSVSAKQERFCEEYLVDFNATKAAIRSGYSSKSASALGYQLLHHPSLQPVLIEKLKAQSIRLGIDADTMLKFLYEVASFEIGELFNDDGTVKRPKELSKLGQRVVSGFKVRELFDRDEEGRKVQVGNIVEVKLNAKIAAIDFIGRWLKMWTRAVEVHDKRDVQELLREATQRARRMRREREESARPSSVRNVPEGAGVKLPYEPDPR